jgi:hypothetical protein
MPRKSDLVWKFEYDVRKRSRWQRLLLVLDQLCNVVCWNGSQDETVSSHIGRRIEAGRAIWIEKLICRGLRRLQNNHCQRAKGE